MRRPSTIDKHPERPAIEAALARAVPLRKLAAKYEVSIDALWRHRKRMRKEQPEVFQALAAADWKVRPEDLEKLRTETADGWLNVLRSQTAKLIAAQDRNLEVGNDTVAAQMAAQIHKVLDMIGRAVDQLGATSVTNIQNNVVLSPAFFEIRTVILEALAPFPEARRAVLARLRQHTAGDEPEASPRPPLLTLEANPEPRP